MKFSTFTFLSFAVFGGVEAFWRMPCRSRTGLARMDPLVNPGQIADHVHAIHGGGNFGLTTTYEDLTQCTGPKDCTSCRVVEDQSAYWTPSLHFVYPNGTMVIVPQVGGMLAYYLLYLDNLEPFPEGFRLLAGNRHQRNFTGPFPDTPLSSWPTDPTDQFFLEQRALGFNCLDYSKTPEPSLYRHQFPSKQYMDANCKDGIRLELAFPSCGNGQLDSPDHQSHVAYPSLVKEGNCPAGFDHHYPFLFFETIWATHAFAGQDGQFVLSHGDPVGTGYHGDFIMGWKSADFLKNAIETCTSGSGEIQDCPLFTIQSDADAAKCTFDVPDILKDDMPEGPRNGLARDVPIQCGPELATPYPCAGRGDSNAATSPAPNNAIAPAYAPTNPVVSTPSAQSVMAAAKVASNVAGVNQSPAAAAAVVTPAPVAYAADGGPSIVATSWLMQGNEVVELIVEEVEITVTALPNTDASYKRHLQRHFHGPRH